jgi:hypothetical protein
MGPGVELCAPATAALPACMNLPNPLHREHLRAPGWSDVDNSGGLCYKYSLRTSPVALSSKCILTCHRLGTGQLDFKVPVDYRIRIGISLEK